MPQWIEGVAPELACQYALSDPDGASLLQPLFGLIYPLPAFALSSPPTA